MSCLSNLIYTHIYSLYIYTGGTMLTRRHHHHPLLLSLQLLLLLLALLLPFTTHATTTDEATTANNHKPSLFQRFTQAFQPTATAAAPAAAPEEAQKPFNVWTAPGELKLMSKMKDGGHLDVLQTMIQTKDLERIWGNPKAFYVMMQNFPMLAGIKGVPELMTKKQEEVTPEDVSERVGGA
jgi:hypothetical protein